MYACTDKAPHWLYCIDFIVRMLANKTSERGFIIIIIFSEAVVVVGGVYFSLKNMFLFYIVCLLGGIVVGLYCAT